MPAEPAALSLPEVDGAAMPASRGWRLPLFPLGVIAIFLIAAIVAPFLGLPDPHEQSLRSRFKPPVWEEGGTWAHALGTDRLGRDLLSRIVWGSRISLAAGVVPVRLARRFGGGGGAPPRR